ncbi:MAG: hypothetical protein VX589_12275 [Myxococcota bacterium]|nr:hypothetical protein [Myxococcota bacterium]
MTRKSEHKRSHWFDDLRSSSTSTEKHVIEAWKRWFDEYVNVGESNARQVEWVRTLGSSLRKATHGLTAARTWLSSQSPDEPNEEVAHLRARVDRLERQLSRHIASTGAPDGSGRDGSEV